MDEPISPRFGVEIEFLGNVSQSSIARALNDAGIPAEAESYNHRTREWWKVTTDSSCGLEVVSPPLFWHQRIVLREVMAILRAQGAQVNETCGFHVHHEWPWWSAGVEDRNDRLLLVRSIYEECEPLLRVLLSPSRWTNERFCKFKSGDTYGFRPGYFCSEHDTDRCGWCAECLGHGECRHTRRAAPRDQLFSDRYVAVNMTALERQETVEFRQFQGTLHTTKALSWVELTRNILHAASRPELGSLGERTAFVFDKLSISTARHLEQRCEEKDTTLAAVIAEITAPVPA